MEKIRQRKEARKLEEEEDTTGDFEQEQILAREACRKDMVSPKVTTRNNMSKVDSKQEDDKQDDDKQDDKSEKEAKKEADEENSRQDWTTVKGRCRVSPKVLYLLYY